MVTGWGGGCRGRGMETGTCGETHTKESRVTIEEMEDFVSLLSDYLFLSENHIFYLRMIGSLSDGQRRLSSKHSLNLGTTKTGSIFAFNPCRPNVFSELTHRKERVPIRKHTTAASGQATEGGLKKNVSRPLPYGFLDSLPTLSSAKGDLPSVLPPKAFPCVCLTKTCADSGTHRHATHQPSSLLSLLSPHSRSSSKIADVSVRRASHRCFLYAHLLKSVPRTSD